MGQLSAALLEKQINVAEKAPGRLVIKLFQKINGKSGREAAVKRAYLRSTTTRMRGTPKAISHVTKYIYDTVLYTAVQLYI